MFAPRRINQSCRSVQGRRPRIWRGWCRKMTFEEQIDVAIQKHGPSDPARNRVLRYLVSVMDAEWRASPGFRSICAAVPEFEPPAIDKALRTLTLKGWVTRFRPDRRDEKGQLIPKQRDVYTLDAAKLVELLKVKANV